MRASAAIQILPNLSDQEEMLAVVDRVIAYIAGSGLSYQVGPFETVIEGEDYGEVMEVVKNCLTVAAGAGAEKVSAYVKLVYKPEGGVLTIKEKTGKYQGGSL
ncbi:MAG: thiamine-binding protein [Lachnospiraceae bacterium]|nr:thiamine-binding protein [Lachnospiraceae bacterium]